jgi:16S rRNA (adenine1518-N6/adenine1519-N6)-dimethyltransferase
LVRAGFGKRRKMLRRALEGMVPPGAFEAAAVRPDSRAEDLDLHAWARLAAASLAAAPPTVAAEADPGNAHE